MTVDPSPSFKRYPYTGLGDYSFSFQVYKGEDLSVAYLGTSGDAIVLVRDSDYSYTLLPDLTGGMVTILDTITTSPLVDGSLTISRILKLEQGVSFVNNHALPMSVIESTFDRAVMMIQQLSDIVTEGTILINYRGGWVTGVLYNTQDMAVASTGSWYVCITAHTSGVFADDLAAGYWVLALDVEYIEQLTYEAEVSAAAALVSEGNALASETQAGISEVNSEVNAQDAANCSASAYDSSVIAAAGAVDAAADADRAEAAANTIPDPTAGNPGDAPLINVTNDGWDYGAAGGGGGLEWQAVSATDVTVEANKGYLQDNSGGSTTLTMPAVPTLNDQIGYKDWANEFDSFPLLFDLNGNLVEGGDTFKVDSRGAGGTLVWSGDASVGWSLVSATPMETIQSKPMMHVQDQKPTGTDGGSSVAGDNQRDLNTVLTNEIQGASLSSNEVTLPAGEYYIEATSNVLSADKGSASIRNSAGDYLLSRTGVYTSSAQAGSTAHNVYGRVSLNSTDSIVVFSNVQSAKTLNGLGIGGSDSNAPHEVYTDLRIWKLDSEKDYPKIYQPVNQVITGAYKTGGVYGGNLVRASDTTFNVEAVSTTADSDDTPLYINATTLVDLGTPAINTIYNVFVCQNSDSSYSIEVDTDINGAALPVAVVKKRWLGFVLVNASGNIAEFYMSDDYFHFGVFSESQFMSGIINVWVDVDYSSVVPVSRVREIMFGGQSDGNNVVYLSDLSDTVGMFGFIRTNAAQSDTQDQWTAEPPGGSTTPTGAVTRAKLNGGTGKLAVQAIRLRR